MKRAYVVQHSYEQDSCEEIKLIGIYSSEQRVSAAIERAKGQPGSCRHPDGFHVDAYEIDRDHWTEGFA